MTNAEENAIAASVLAIIATLAKGGARTGPLEPAWVDSVEYDRYVEQPYQARKAMREAA